MGYWRGARMRILSGASTWSHDPYRLLANHINYQCTDRFLDNGPVCNNR
jgi:hypothetical protein